MVATFANVYGIRSHHGPKTLTRARVCAVDHVHLLAIGVFLQTDASGRETETTARWPGLPTPRPASGSTAVFDTGTASWAYMAQVLRYTPAVPAACCAHASNKCYRS